MIDTSRSMIYHITNLNDEQRRISNSLGTGLALEKGSDDAMRHSRIINVEDKLRVTEDLKLQLEKSKALNDTADKNMAEIKSALDSIKEDLLKGLNAGMSRSDKLALAANLEGIRDNIFDRINVQVDGEYIFTGSMPTKQTIAKDASFDLNGKVSFGGDGFLRQIAVQPGSYRDRGITAYDAVFYNGSSALAGQAFTFSYGERIVDENGNEWKVMDASGVEYNKDDGGATAPNFLQKFDHNGRLVDPATDPTARIAITGTTAEVEATATNQATQMTLSINVPASPEGRVFEAKHNFFDDLNEVINALKGHSTKLDGTKGPVINDELVNTTLSSGLTKTSKQFDATNIGHGKLGGRNNVFNISYEKILTQETHYNILLKETSGADTAKLAMESKALEVTYQALYSTIAKMNQLSLVNYVK